MESWDELVTRNQELALGHAYRRLGDHLEAEDVVGDAWAGVVRSVGAGHIEYPDALFWTILRRKIVDRIRSRVRRKLAVPRWVYLDRIDPDWREPLGNRVIGMGPDPADQVVDREDAARVRAAVRRLPARYREVVAIRSRGYQHREVASLLGTTFRTAENRWNRAVARLRRDLQGAS